MYQVQLGLQVHLKPTPLELKVDLYPALLGFEMDLYIVEIMIDTFRHPAEADLYPSLLRFEANVLSGTFIDRRGHVPGTSWVCSEHITRYFS